jgi:hypothetical protein
MFLKAFLAGTDNSLYINSELIEVIQATADNTAAVRYPQNFWYEVRDFTAQQLVEKMNDWANPHG